MILGSIGVAQLLEGEMYQARGAVILPAVAIVMIASARPRRPVQPGESVNLDELDAALGGLQRAAGVRTVTGPDGGRLSNDRSTSHRGSGSETLSRKINLLHFMSS